MQGFNQTLLGASIGLILSSVLLFITNTHARRKYYIGNYAAICLSAVANIGVDPRLGDYEFEELVQIVHHQMQLAITPKNMAAIFTPNVRDERNPFLKVVPLGLKNLVMRMVFDSVGENVSTLSLSNLGRVELPEAMAPYVERVEFVLGPQASSPYNASCTSWRGKTYFNIVRNSVEPALEREFFTALVKMGLHVKIETNDE